ncbi:hypothetical protein [Parabacteroides sp. AM08-6]|uniref:hypothetical protein n=1 Tax=Parabacteroides sp. AM08-6 TaxID=2292053 RepID=UPI000EFDBB5E|nr:hypothetical protein [Parabacteroides sp. AM08-6]RHJ87615.1 hypothetical protein DW103_00075 [Parabacteroides sp. AM08-6]
MKIVHIAYISLFCILFSFFTIPLLHAEDWRDKTKLLIYSPRYFGPNAFPLPEMRNGDVSKRIEAEVRGEYHYYKGDKTKDLYARVLVPFVKGRAGVEVSLVVLEKYKMTPETRDERFAVATESPIRCTGDVIFTSFFQVLRSEKWADIVLSGTIRTASGGRLCDARYTDAAAYWFDLNIARNLWKSTDGKASLRMQVLGGFYCWMTNDLVHRQNDAMAYGGGLTGTYKGFTLSSDISGIRGYKNNGDRPIHWRNKLSYELKKNILSFRYTHGMKDRLYESYSLGYTRCF